MCSYTTCVLESYCQITVLSVRVGKFRRCVWIISLTYSLTYSAAVCGRRVQTSEALPAVGQSVMMINGCTLKSAPARLSRQNHAAPAAAAHRARLPTVFETDWCPRPDADSYDMVLISFVFGRLSWPSGRRGLTVNLVMRRWFQHLCFIPLDRLILQCLRIAWRMALYIQGGPKNWHHFCTP